MALRKFRIDYSDYIIVEDFETKMEHISDRYGKYTISKILTIDYIKACEDKVLGPITDFADKIREGLSMKKYVSLETRNFNGTNLSKFEVYTALPEDNIDWVDPENKCKKLPIALSRKTITELIEKNFKR